MLPYDWAETIKRALAEDIGQGDVTTRSLISPQAKCTASLEFKQEGILAGLAIAEYAFGLLDPEVEFTAWKEDGERIAAGTVVAEIRGKTAAILTAERVSLNFLQRLSGIATVTAAYASELTGTGARLLDTRKTTPGLRSMEKYAVRMGGGYNHRFNLADGVLIKDNHIIAAGGIANAIAAARAKAAALLKIEVEVETLTQLEEALAAGADFIMLDNMDLTAMRQAVERAAGKVRLEASGGINLKKIRSIAETGVDYISVGALTHSVLSIDISLNLEEKTMEEDSSGLKTPNCPKEPFSGTERGYVL